MPGPNNPVGSYWIGLSAEGYGIHGTPNPSIVGKSELHGCVRLTNWDGACDAASNIDQKRPDGWSNVGLHSMNIDLRGAGAGLPAAYDGQPPFDMITFCGLDRFSVSMLASKSAARQARQISGNGTVAVLDRSSLSVVMPTATFRGTT